MKRLIGGTLMGLAAMTLAGCGSDEAGQDAGSAPAAEEVQQAAKSISRPTPGEYRQTVEITRFEVPGMSEEQAEQVRAMLANVPEKTFCLTEEEADKGFKDMLDSLPGDSECSYSRFDVDSGRLDAQMECKDASGATAKATMAGTVSSEGSDVLLDIEQGIPGSGGQKSLMSMHARTTRLDDCTS
jgi:hypothetical protein